MMIIINMIDHDWQEVLFISSWWWPWLTWLTMIDKRFYLSVHDDARQSLAPVCDCNSGHSPNCPGCVSNRNTISWQNCSPFRISYFLFLQFRDICGVFLLSTCLMIKYAFSCQLPSQDCWQTNQLWAEPWQCWQLSGWPTDNGLQLLAFFLKFSKHLKYSKCQNFQIFRVNCQRFAMTRIILQNTWPQLDFHHLSLHPFNRFTPSQESHPSTIKQRISFFSFFSTKNEKRRSGAPWWHG